MGQQVSSYRVQYNLSTNQGVVDVKLEDGSNGPLNVNSDQELIVALLLLSKTPVDYDSASQVLKCGSRPAGT